MSAQPGPAGAVVPKVPLAVFLVMVLAASGVALAYPGFGFTFVLVVATVTLLATGLLPEYVTALLFFTVAMLGRIAPQELVFSGFESSAFWLILAGLFLGLAVSESGLGERMGNAVARVLPASYGWALVGVGFVGLALAFVMPSAMGRVLLYLPIARSLGIRLGYEEGSRGLRGITLCGIFCTFQSAMSILPANIPNMVLVGSVEAQNMPSPTYVGYLVLHFPILGVLKTLLICGVVRYLYPAKAPQAVVDHVATPLNRQERLLVPILVLCLAFWATDTWHHISPAWVGMAGALACLMPGIRVLDARVIQKLNMASLFYVAAIISLGAIVSYAGIGQKVASGLLDILPLSPGNEWRNFGLFGLLATLLGPLTTQPGIPAVLTPLASHLSEASGFSINAVLMTQVLGFSTVLFPFQTAPLLVGVRLLGIPIAEATRFSLLVAALSIALLWPLDCLWWQLLGLI